MSKIIKIAVYVALSSIFLSSCARKENIKEQFNRSTTENEAEVPVS